MGHAFKFLMRSLEALEHSLQVMYSLFWCNLLGGKTKNGGSFFSGVRG